MLTVGNTVCSCGETNMDSEFGKRVTLKPLPYYATSWRFYTYIDRENFHSSGISNWLCASCPSSLYFPGVNSDAKLFWNNISWTILKGPMRTLREHWCIKMVTRGGMDLCTEENLWIWLCSSLSCNISAEFCWTRIPRNTNYFFYSSLLRVACFGNSSIGIKMSPLELWRRSSLVNNSSIFQPWQQDIKKWI